MPPADNSRYLAEASRRRHEIARDRATRAIDAAARRGTATTFAGIASAAGVSRSWLYTQDDLRTAIAELKHRRPAPSRPAPRRNSPEEDPVPAVSPDAAGLACRTAAFLAGIRGSEEKP